MGSFRTRYRLGWRTSQAISAPSVSPWLAGGIDPSAVVAIYRPSVASSLSQSYLRVAGTGGNANLDPAVVGNGVAPGFSSGSWTFTGSQFLDTGINNLSLNHSVIVKYSDALANLRFMYGVYGSGTDAFALRITNSDAMNPYNGANSYYSPALLGGVYSICGKNCYRNKSLDGALAAGGTVPAINFYIGQLNGIAGLFITANIQEVFIYSSVITQPQVSAIIDAIS